MVAMASSEAHEVEQLAEIKSNNESSVWLDGRRQGQLHRKPGFWEQGSEEAIHL